MQSFFVTSGLNCLIFPDLFLLDLNSFSADTEGANEIEGSAGKGIEIPCKGASFFPRMILCNSAKIERIVHDVIIKTIISIFVGFKLFRRNVLHEC